MQRALGGAPSDRFRQGLDQQLPDATVTCGGLLAAAGGVYVTEQPVIDVPDEDCFVNTAVLLGVVSANPL
jgi:hypothetical protein